MTTATGSAEEVPFLSAMEREPPKEDWHEVTVTVENFGRKIFTADGMLAELLKRLRNALNARGPDPDYPEQDDDIRRLAHLIERLASRPPSPPMRNGDDDGDGRDLKKWLAGVAAVLAVGFIVGGWTISNQVAAQSVKIDNLTEQMKSQNERITRIEQQRAN